MLGIAWTLPSSLQPAVVAWRHACQRSLTGGFFINVEDDEAERSPAETNEGSVRVSALTDDFGREAADKTLWSERRARTKGKQLCCSIAVLHQQHHSSLSSDFISLHFSLFILARPLFDSFLQKKKLFWSFLWVNLRRLRVGFLAFFLRPPAAEWAGRPIVLKPHQILWLFLIESMQHGLWLHMEDFSSHLLKISCTMKNQQMSSGSCCPGNLAPHWDFVLEESETTVWLHKFRKQPGHERMDELLEVFRKEKQDQLFRFKGNKEWKRVHLKENDVW